MPLPLQSVLEIEIPDPVPVRFLPGQGSPCPALVPLWTVPAGAPAVPLQISPDEHKLLQFVQLPLLSVDALPQRSPGRSLASPGRASPPLANLLRLPLSRSIQTALLSF